MNPMGKRVVVGVMGSADRAFLEANRPALEEMARRLGRSIAEHKCVLLTGATTGLPALVSRAARERGGLTIGVSPAASAEEHVDGYGLLVDDLDVIIYTGFGLKGRNVINVRASDVVVIFGGGMGTLNEFTIAYDEGKVIGVLVGSGGVTDLVDSVTGQLGLTGEGIIFSHQPETLIDGCLALLRSRLNIGC
jgi:uncharacterized protein (TIGR00725 family)